MNPLADSLFKLSRDTPGYPPAQRVLLAGLDRVTEKDLFDKWKCKEKSDAIIAADLERDRVRLKVAAVHISPNKQYDGFDLVDSQTGKVLQYWGHGQRYVAPVKTSIECVTDAISKDRIETFLALKSIGVGQVLIYSCGGWQKYPERAMVAEILGMMFMVEEWVEEWVEE